MEIQGLRDRSELAELRNQINTLTTSGAIYKATMDTENASLMEQSTLDREAVVMLRTHLTDTKSAASIKQAEDDKKIAELTATLRRAYEV